ncbi:MAG: metalloregulator ArsR/SmtB family transcription factor [Acidimicrobiia bacterium]|nr:metalloregulator ArsR/SmtB family transcription factor [Acidimicrobiia bacterium]
MTQAPPCCEENLPPVLVITVDEMAAIAKALAHPARIRILEQFDECVPRVVGDIVADCRLAQSTVSEHLRILREANLLFARKDGPRTWYCVRRSVLHAFSRALDDLAIEPVLHQASGH